LYFFLSLMASEIIFSAIMSMIVGVSVQSVRFFQCKQFCFSQVHLYIFKEDYDVEEVNDGNQTRTEFVNKMGGKREDHWYLYNTQADLSEANREKWFIERDVSTSFRKLLDWFLVRF